MAAIVSVPVLCDQAGNFYGNVAAGGAPMNVGTDSIVGGIVKKPGSRAVPPNVAPLVDTLEIKDKSLGTVYALMTVAEYQFAATVAENPWMLSAPPFVVAGTGTIKLTGGYKEFDAPYILATSKVMVSLWDEGVSATTLAQQYAVDVFPGGFSVQALDSAGDYQTSDNSTLYYVVVNPSS